MLRVFALLGWLNFHRNKMSHISHHLHTLHPRGDRKLVLPQCPSLVFPHLLQLFTIAVVGGFESKANGVR